MAVVTSDPRRLIARLAATPLRLRGLTDDLGADEVTRPPKPGEWSAAEVVLHLVEGDRDRFVPRLRRMLSEDTPVFDAARPARAADLTLDLTVLRDVFAQARGQAVAILEKLAPDDWQRRGVSPSRGRLTVERYAATMAGHDLEHLGQLNQVRRAFGRRPLRCEAGDPMPLAEIVATVAATPDDIARVVAGLPSEAVRWRPRPGEWSMKEVTAHLLKVERDLFLLRLRRMRDEEWPSFEPFDPEAWAAERDWRQGDVGSDLAEFRAVRDETRRLLAALRPGDLDRMGVSAAFGAVTLHEYATHVAEHDGEHLAQLESLRRALAG